jgi:hypothetical protein
MRARKRMLRLLIEDVTLLRDRAIQIAIRWKGGRRPPWSGLCPSTPLTFDGRRRLLSR